MKILIMLFGLALSIDSPDRVSIRPTTRGAGPVAAPAYPVSYYCRKCPLRNLVSLAFATGSHRVVGPKFIETEYFDVDVKTAAPGAPTGAEAVKEALENLLHLKTHRENREMSGFELTIAPGGPRITRSADSPSDQAADVMLRIPDGAEGASSPSTGLRWTFRFYNGGLTAEGSETLDVFARQLSFAINKPVADSTGLGGRYRFDFSGLPANGRRLPLSTLNRDLRDQLGLALRETKGPFEVLVVDSVDKFD